jgi:N-acetyl-anhydromuramyl-L-alanine amidase AmpD
MRERKQNMQINQVGMTRAHYTPGSAGRIRMVVLHATAGRFPSDFNWLRNGGGNIPQTWVSIHYYITKSGEISQMVADANIAWHAGRSTWIVDGQRIEYSVGCNPVSVGIELENLNNGRDPYPQAQYAAALWLTRRLVGQYNVPRSQLVRHLDIAPRRKIDPAGFPWARFVSEVYNFVPPPVPPVAPLPRLEPLPPSDQLQELLVDLAYRAIGSAYPAGWPVLQETVSLHTGMPVAAVTAPPPPTPAEFPERDARAVDMPGQPPFIIEIYGRDLFYAPTANPEQLQRLSNTQPPLRDGLLQVLFLTADPANGFRPDWAFHQFYLEHMTEIGVPVGPNHRLPVATSNGQTYACQHFGLDSLCSPVGQWSTIIRLSDLTREMYSGDPHPPLERELRALLLNDLYQNRIGQNFDQDALFNRYAIQENLGAPIGRAEFQEIDGEQIVAMPFALDTIYARVPPDGNWGRAGVGRLTELLAPES